MLAHMPESRPTIVVSDIHKDTFPITQADDAVLLNDLMIGRRMRDREVPKFTSFVEIQLSDGRYITLLDQMIPVQRGDHETCEWCIGLRSTTPDCWQPIFASDVDDKTFNSPFRRFVISQHEPNGFVLKQLLYSGMWPHSLFLESNELGEYADIDVPGRVDPCYSTRDIRGAIYRFVDVHTLAAGDVLAREYPFSRQSWWRRGETVQTNGVFPVPFEKPRGDKAWELWHRCRGLRSISGRKAWSDLLRALNGQYFADVLSQLGGSQAQVAPSPLLRARIRDIKADRPPRTAEKAPCFSGYGVEGKRFANCTSSRIRWDLESSSGEKVFVIDSEEVSACYIFLGDREEDARDWHEFRVDYRSARKRAYRVIMHIPGWERVVEELLSNLGVLKTC